MYDAIRLAVGRGHELVLVGTCASIPEYRTKEADFERLAREAGCRFFIDANINDAKYVGLARESGAEIALSVNWLTMIGPAMIAAFPLGILNAHAGDLPRYRGNACPNWAILAGEDHIGACVHIMVPELDAGPIAVRRRFPLTSDTYIGEVYEFLDREFPRMLVEGMEGLGNGSLKPEPQREDPALALRCFPRGPDDGRIDWRDSAQQICRLIRASSKPFAGAFTYLDGRRLTVWRAREETFHQQSMGVPGQVIRIDRKHGHITVLAGERTVVLEEVAIDGVSRPPAELITSARIRLGLDAIVELENLRAEFAKLQRTMQQRAD
jgi:methionyl-tRNA formyltransferase